LKSIRVVIFSRILEGTHLVKESIATSNFLLLNFRTHFGSRSPSMPRFADNWVVDKCMFDYVGGGVCACCGFSHLFIPGGFEGMVASMTDLETDAAEHEINAAKASPWPPDMRDQIWSDRLLLRFRMKKEMKKYRSSLEGIVKDDTRNGKINIEDAIPILKKFCINDLTPNEVRRIFQLPRSELTELLRSKYNICSAYAVVFCTVVSFYSSSFISHCFITLCHPHLRLRALKICSTLLFESTQVEQVANFEKTGYPVDARSGLRGNYEEKFEKELTFAKAGPGFCLKIATGTGDNWKVDEEVLLMFLRRMVSLAGPTLLERAPKCSYDDEDKDKHNHKDDREADNASENNELNVTSFRSDRRVVRLLIARYWADRLIEKYCCKIEKGKQQKTEAEQ